MEPYLTALFYVMIFVIIAAICFYVINLFFPIGLRIRRIAGAIILLIAVLMFCRLGGLINL